MYYCKDCGKSGSYLIRTAIGLACPACGKVHDYAVQKATSPKVSEHERAVWVLVAVVAGAFGIKKVFDLLDELLA